MADIPGRSETEIFNVNTLTSPVSFSLLKNRFFMREIMINHKINLYFHGSGAVEFKSTRGITGVLPS